MRNVCTLWVLYAYMFLHMCTIYVHMCTMRREKKTCTLYISDSRLENYEEKFYFIFRKKSIILILLCYCVNFHFPSHYHPDWWYFTSAHTIIPFPQSVHIKDNIQVNTLYSNSWNKSITLWFSIEKTGFTGAGLEKQYLRE